MAAYQMWKMLERSLTGQLTYSSVDLSQSSQVVVLFCLKVYMSCKKARSSSTPGGGVRYIEQ